MYVKMKNSISLEIKIRYHNRNSTFYNIWIIKLKKWTIWTYFASAEAFLPKISFFNKIEADRDQ